MNPILATADVWDSQNGAGVVPIGGEYSIPGKGLHKAIVGF